MKSERRHELQKNELADRLASGIESTRPILPFILSGLLLLAVASLGWGIYSSFAKRKASVAWTEFYFNLTRDDGDSYIDLADDYPKSTAAGWARQIAADNYLRQGIEALYRNRSEGEELIGKAIKAYEQVDKTAQNPELRTKALLGLAQAHESLGQTDKAASFYQQLAKAATQPGIVNEANQRLAFLTSESGKEFYDWFNQLDPKPDAPITLPSDLSSPPASPDIQFGPSDVDESTLPAAAAEIDLGDLPALPSQSENTSEESAASPSADLPDLPVVNEVPAEGGLELEP